MRVLRDAAAAPASCRSSPASASDRDGRLLNVNADTFAGHLAARLARAAARHRRHDGRRARRATARRSPLLDPASIARLLADGTANGRHDRQAARVRARARRRRGRCRDRGRPRSAGAARGRVPARRAGVGDDGMAATAVTRVMTTSHDCHMTSHDRALDDIQALEARHVLQTYRRAPVTFVRGQGVRLYDCRGPRVSRPAVRHRRRLARPRASRDWRARSPIRRRRCSTRRTCSFTRCRGRLAERLAALSGLPRAFFCNSGAEAVEACLKFARRYWYTRGEPRAEFIALEESFHGRTFGALSVTSDEHYRAPFEPLVPGVRFVPVERSGGAARGGVVDRRPRSSPSRFRARAACGR